MTIKESKNDLSGSEHRSADDRVVELHKRTQAARELAFWDKTEREAMESLAFFRVIYGEESPAAANISNYLARIAESRMQYATAEQHARRAWEIMERLGDRCDDRKAISVRIEAMTRIGTSLRAAGYYDEADIWLQRALDLAERNGLEMVTTLNNFGVLCKCSGRFDEIESPLLTATASEKGLASFHLKSLKSRAAARSLLEERKANEEGGPVFVLKCLVHDSVLDLSRAGVSCALIWWVEGLNTLRVYPNYTTSKDHSSVSFVPMLREHLSLCRFLPYSTNIRRKKRNITIAMSSMLSPKQKSSLTWLTKGYNASP